jgi:quinone-modifying oxidoreductase subunit QmoC
MIEISPDIKFIEKLQEATGSQLTTCMQCGACTASCSLSQEQNVFPRKQMIMAAWGMRQQLMADPHIWTCHQCGDCTVSCPRGVKPGEILSALRLEQITNYSKPGILARWMQKPAFLPIAILFPALVIILILSLAGTFAIPEGPVDYSKFFPHGWLNGSFTAFFVLATIGAVTGLRNFWKNMKQASTATGTYTAGAGATIAAGATAAPAGQETDPSMEVIETSKASQPISSFLSVIGRIMKHKDFNSCDEQKSRSLSHFLVFWGFILLLFVTFFAILSTLFFEYPLDILNPIKIAGNLGGIMLITGSSLMILNRLIKRKNLQSSYADWFFLISFWLLSISGMLVEAARFHEWSFAYHMYFFHLIMVWIIILYFPYTKFAHFLYRTIALIFIRSKS